MGKKWLQRENCQSWLFSINFRKTIIFFSINIIWVRIPYDFIFTRAWIMNWADHKISKSKIFVRVEHLNFNRIRHKSIGKKRCNKAIGYPPFWRVFVFIQVNLFFVVNFLATLIWNMRICHTFRYQSCVCALSI